MAGGTGGHVFPGLALAYELSQRDFKVEWLGTRLGIEARLVPNAGIRLHFIPVRGIRGKGLLSVLLAPINVVSSIYWALRVIKKLNPDIVVGLGGFVAGPGGVAAKLLGIPLLIHEQNAIAGTTNKLLAKIAKRVLMAFPDSIKNGVCIGNPVRQEIENIDLPEARFSSRGDTINLLVIGGSRGAQAINELMPSALQALKDLVSADSFGQLEIWHQAGEGKLNATKRYYLQAGVPARIEPFIDNMAEAFAWADIVVCRSGALTVSELSAAGLGAIFIPYPYAIDDHQTENARHLERVGAAIVKQQSDLSADSLAALFEQTLFDKETLLNMSVKAKKMAKLNAAQIFADNCEEFVHA